eukprot:8025395-Alexandrium_andersonii.AAC.1
MVDRDGARSEEADVARLRRPGVAAFGAGPCSAATTGPTNTTSSSGGVGGAQLGGGSPCPPGLLLGPRSFSQCSPCQLVSLRANQMVMRRAPRSPPTVPRP